MNKQWTQQEDSKSKRWEEAVKPGGRGGLVARCKNRERLWPTYMAYEECGTDDMILSRITH
jgi:hypothetical protein